MTVFLCFLLNFLLFVFTLFSSWNVLVAFSPSFCNILILSNDHSVLLYSPQSSEFPSSPLLSADAIECELPQLCLLNLPLTTVIIFLFLSSYNGRNKNSSTFIWNPMFVLSKSLLLHLPLSYIFKPDFSTSTFQLSF